MRFHLMTWRWPGVLALLAIVSCSILVLHISTVLTPTAAATVLASDDDEDEDDDDERADSIEHAVAGREDCLSCHRPDGGVKESPDNHAGFGNDLCLTCHAPEGGDLASSRAERIPHPVDGWDNCGFCHQPEAGLKPSPRNHADFGNDGCRACHGDGGTLEAGVLQQARPLGPSIPHGVQGREDCLQCHQPGGGVRPAPVSHQGLSREACTLCHQAVAGAPASVASPVASPYPAIPHAIEGREDCLACHQAGGGVRPAPLDHGWITSSTDCRNCHVSAIGGAPSAPSGPAAYPAIPHPLEGRQDCLACHQAGAGLQPSPLDHAWMTSSGDCRNCHALAAGQLPPGPVMVSPYPSIPHSVAGREDCLACHQAGSGIRPAPLDHAWIADSVDCRNCHQPQ